MSTDKRSRRRNFSEQELTMLTDEVSTNSDVLFAPFSPVVTNKRKADLWEIIAEKVSAVGSSKRNGFDVRKKWNELKCQIRKKEQIRKRELSKTGGGPAPNPLSSLENKVICLIPTCQIDGIPGGLESGLCGDVPGTFDVPDCQDPIETESSQSVVASPTGVIQKTSVKRIATVKSPKFQTVVDLEREKLHVLQEMLEIERRRLAIEERRQAVEEKRLAIDEEMLILIKNKTLSSPFTLSPIIKFN